MNNNNQKPRKAIINIKMEKSLHLKFKIKAAQNNISMTDVLVSAIKEYVESE